MRNSFIWHIDKILSGATSPGQSGPGSDGNEEELCIHQSSSITGGLPSDCSKSYPEHSLGDLSPLRDPVGVFHNPCRLGSTI